MKKNQPVNYILLLCCLFVLGCSEEETSSDELTVEEAGLEITEEVLLTTLNAADLDILERCSELSGDVESVNCCVVWPDSVVVNEMYFAASRYIISDGNGLVYEPEGLTYEWKLTGNGIKISDATAQFVLLEFDQNFEGASVVATVFGSDGTPRCIANDSIHLKE
ncbi:MAG: hypothetical protein AAGF96_05810 [Bacteroidota bacterium]